MALRTDTGKETLSVYTKPRNRGGVMARGGTSDPTNGQDLYMWEPRGPLTSVTKPR